MNFEWDASKAQLNLKNHDLSFEEASLIFEDFFGLELFDDAHSTIDEERFIRLGLANGRLVLVIYTLRGENPDVYRLISARLAEKDEEKIYWEERNEQ